jgi:hypothetical protein
VLKKPLSADVDLETLVLYVLSACLDAPRRGDASYTSRSVIWLRLKDPESKFRRQ